VIEVTDSNVDEAINRVLLAEREAQEAVDDCREQAHAILDGARLKVARIKARTDDRITRVQELSDQSISRRIGAIRTEANAIHTRADLSSKRLEELQDAIDLLIKEIV
jgi:vacuolar-type H+-ATPase subunit H